MFRFTKTFQLMVIFLGIVLLSGVIIVLAQELNPSYRIQQTPPSLAYIRTPSPIRPSECVPLPRAKQVLESATPTRSPFSPTESGISSLLGLAPSVTPRIFANIIDLNPEVPLRDKWEIIVFRCNGNYDKYLRASGTDIDLYLKMEPGDIIINTIPPLSMMGHEPPEPFSDQTATPPSGIAQPESFTPTEGNIAQTPYPIQVTLTP